MRKLKINFQKFVPYSTDAVLSQYYDYEHIEHVHPNTLGRYQLLEQREDFVSYRQVWPKTVFSEPTSIVEQRFSPPNRILFEFVKGRYKGTRIHTVLLESQGGTVVDETYEMNLPGWGWLGKIVKPFIVKRVNQIWEEDTDVEVCRDGWPGVPKSARVLESCDSNTAGSSPPSVPRSLSSIPVGEARAYTVGKFEIAVFNVAGDIFAVENRCPHTGGPLVLGSVLDGTVVCPWHGARFDLCTGNVVCGPAENAVRTFPLREVDGQIVMDDQNAL